MGFTRRINFLPLIVLVLMFFGSSCNKSDNNSSIITQNSPGIEGVKIKIVTTFLPVYVFTKAVAGDVADVEILVPPSAEVHEYQATPDNVRAIATANVLVKNGLGVEKFLANIVNNSQNPQLLEIDTSSGIKETPKEQNLRDVNPHIWLDPVLAQQQIINIRDGLIRADPRNKTTYQTNARKYIQELKNLDAEFTNALKQTPNCTFITFHDAFPYLAQRYHLHQLAVVEIPEDQLSPADVEKAVNAVKKYKVKTLFSELGVDNKLLTSLSRDLHLTLHPLNSLENGETNPEYYFKAMRANLQAITAGCNS